MTERRRQGRFQPFKRLFGKKKKKQQVDGGFDGADLKASVSTGEVCNGVVSDDEGAVQNLRSVLRECQSRVQRMLTIQTFHVTVCDCKMIAQYYTPVSAGRSIPSDLEPCHTTASSFRTSPWQSPPWITACPRKTYLTKFGICRWDICSGNWSVMPCAFEISNSLFLITQRQIAQGIKFGQRPPSLRRSEGDEGSSDEEEVPQSPLKVLAQVEAEPPQPEPKVGSVRVYTDLWKHPFCNWTAKQIQTQLYVFKPDFKWILLADAVANHTPCPRLLSLGLGDCAGLVDLYQHQLWSVQSRNSMRVRGSAALCAVEVVLFLSEEMDTCPQRFVVV